MGYIKLKQLHSNNNNTILYSSDGEIKQSDSSKLSWNDNTETFKVDGNIINDIFEVDKNNNLIKIEGNIASNFTINYSDTNSTSLLNFSGNNSLSISGTSAVGSVTGNFQNQGILLKHEPESQNGTSASIVIEGNISNIIQLSVQDNINASIYEFTPRTFKIASTINIDDYNNDLEESSFVTKKYVDNLTSGSGPGPGPGPGPTSNATVTNSYYQISNAVDTRPVYTDEYVTINWDETGNDLEFQMDVEPTGSSGDMRSFAHVPGGSVVNTFITTPGVSYDVYPPGVSAGNLMEAFISPENDIDYPSYKITVYNTGESFRNTIWVQRIERV